MYKGNILKLFDQFNLGFRVQKAFMNAKGLGVEQLTQ